MEVMFWNFARFQYRFDSPQVKRDLISIIKHIINPLRPKFSKNLKCSTNCLIPSLPSKNKAMVIVSYFNLLQLQSFSQTFITTWKVSAFGAILVRSSPHSDCLSPHSVRMHENTDQKNSEYGHFIGSVLVQKYYVSITNTIWKLSTLVGGVFPI